jgi:hypothetical protein
VLPPEDQAGAVAVRSLRGELVPGSAHAREPDAYGSGGVLRGPAVLAPALYDDGGVDEYAGLVSLR